MAINIMVLGAEESGKSIYLNSLYQQFNFYYQQDKLQLKIGKIDR